MEKAVTSTTLFSTKALDSIRSLKDEGNRYYLDGCKKTNSSSLKTACQKYAEGIETLSHLESNLDVGVATQEWYTFLEDLCNLKVTLFLNLAASNLKLYNFDGARRCCNASILFSNKPQLKLEDMGVEDDLNNVDIEVLQPVNEARVQFIVKALFRRGKCLLGLNLLSKSRSDLLLGLSLLRSAKIVNKDEMEDDLKACLDDVEKCISREKELSSIVENDNSDWKVNNTDHFSVEKMIQSFPFSIMVNGGFCMMRQAAWSQSVPDATVYIPLSLFATIADQISTELPKIDNKTKWRVEFEPHALTVKYYGNLIFYENLEHNIVPSQCLWMLEDHSKSSVQQAMVLYLHKATSLEWFPGCEWWDRVFPTDEPIDTLTCSIGTDVSQLPDNARQRAHKEHGLFEDLDPSAQRCALEHLQQSKQAFAASELATRDAAQAEDLAIAEVPERAAMLNDLRKEFPHIDFTAK